MKTSTNGPELIEGAISPSNVPSAVIMPFVIAFFETACRDTARDVPYRA
jgi:hypothetical protein